MADSQPSQTNASWIGIAPADVVLIRYSLKPSVHCWACGRSEPQKLAARCNQLLDTMCEQQPQGAPTRQSPPTTAKLSTMLAKCDCTSSGNVRRGSITTQILCETHWPWSPQQAPELSRMMISYINYESRMV